MTGWNLPPGVTQKMLDDQVGFDCEHCGECIGEYPCSECAWEPEGPDPDEWRDRYLDEK